MIIYSLVTGLACRECRKGEAVDDRVKVFCHALQMSLGLCPARIEIPAWTSSTNLANAIVESGISPIMRILFLSGMKETNVSPF